MSLDSIHRYGCGRVLRTEHAQQLLANAEKLEAELLHFNEVWRSFRERNADHLGVILICHLAVEHYPDEWLASCEVVNHLA